MLSLRAGHDGCMASSMPEAAAPQRFSPWINDARDCRICRHSVGMDGPQLWCRRVEIVVVFACGAWEREPGADT